MWAMAQNLLSCCKMTKFVCAPPISPPPPWSNFSCLETHSLSIMTMKWNGCSMLIYQWNFDEISSPNDQVTTWKSEESPRGCFAFLTSHCDLSQDRKWRRLFNDFSPPVGNCPKMKFGGLLGTIDWCSLYFFYVFLFFLNFFPCPIWDVCCSRNALSMVVQSEKQLGTTTGSLRIILRPPQLQLLQIIVERSIPSMTGFAYLGLGFDLKVSLSRLFEECHTSS